MFRFVVLTALLACAAADVVQLLDGRIVGGSSASIEQYPHQVSMRRSGSHICGGSIYKANVVVTAAHCTGSAASAYTVVAGTSSRTGAGTSRSVSRVVVHPNYNGNTINNDVALLILSSPFTFTSSIQPIALATAAPAAGSSVTVTGWGTTSENGSAASTLQQVTVNVVSNTQCNSNYGGGITSVMICAGVDAGGKDACQGDSGGPLIQSGKLVGIVSWGYGCARRGYPGVYSNVAALRSWIENNS